MRRRWLAVVLLAAAACAGGCSRVDPAEPASDPIPAARSTAAPSPASPAPPVAVPRAASAAAGSDGFTVRYRDADGEAKTVRVEDFPR